MWTSCGNCILKVAKRSILLVTFFAILASSLPTASGQGAFLRRTKVPVRGPTRMDWLYPLTRTSPKEQPENLLAGYKSTRQRYDFYGPRANGDPGPHALVLFISFKETPMGWPLIGPTCIREGVIYVEPHNAGNRTPIVERIRIALDCLDDVRRRFKVDPDRTYLAGYSGGATTATMIAMALPEYFGGVIASSNSFSPPTTPWRMDRVRSRLSIASICGAKEPAGFEMPNVQTPIFRAMGIRMHSHAVPMLGHAAPPPAVFDQAFLWLDAAASDRRRAAGARPAIRIQGNLTREQWAAAALKDCEELLQDSDRIHLALGLLTEIRTRWNDTNQAVRAKEILDEYDQKTNKPWVEIAKQERLEITETMARTYDAAATALNSTKIQRAVYAQGAIDNYRILIRDSGDATLIGHGNERIPILQKLVENVPIPIPSTLPGVKKRAKLMPSQGVGGNGTPGLKTSFSFAKGMPADEVLQSMGEALAKVGFRIDVQAKRIRDAGLSTKRKLTTDIINQSLEQTLKSILNPIGLTHDIRQKRIEIYPRFE